MAKILKSNKPKGKSTIVLAKAKKINEVIPKKVVDFKFEIENEVKEVKSDLETLVKEHKSTDSKRKVFFFLFNLLIYNICVFMICREKMCILE